MRRIETGLNRDLKSGWLCLEFTNTVQWHASAKPEERLHSYADLLSWAVELELLSERDHETLLGEAKARPSEAGNALRRAIELREGMYRIFLALVQEKSPPESDLMTIDEAIPKATEQMHLTHTSDGFEWKWQLHGGGLEGMLAPIVHSATELLTSDLLENLGQCADDRGCGWLFVDMSKNHSRRWCDINDCGNRAKQQRRYKRLREARK